MNPTSSRPNKNIPCTLSTTDHAVGSVLVMDDEALIRHLASSMLKHLGYKAATCINGEEAIEMYRSAKESGTPYLAVIIDLMILGGMGGKEAAEQILRIDPNAKLIISSAYSGDPVMVDHKDFGFYASLPKPYKLSDMAETLASLHSL